MSMKEKSPKRADFEGSAGSQKTVPQCCMLEQNTNNTKLIPEGIIHPQGVGKHRKRLLAWILKVREPQSSDAAPELICPPS